MSYKDRLHPPISSADQLTLRMAYVLDGGGKVKHISQYCFLPVTGLSRDFLRWDQTSLLKGAKTEQQRTHSLMPESAIGPSHLELFKSSPWLPSSAYFADFKEREQFLCI